jgi:multicomponent Na+:H+ antiporter subunit D
MGAFTVAALSMIGVPPACGFFSKWYLVSGSIDAGNWIFIVVIAASSLLNAVYFFRVLEKVYTADPEDGENTAAKSIEAPREMLFTILLLAAGILILGIINAIIVNNVLKPIVM